MFSTDVCLISDGADDITGHDTVIVTNLKAETLHALGRRPTILGRSSAPGGCVVGAMAVLIGIAARNSIDKGRAVRIDELTDLTPQKDKWS